MKDIKKQMNSVKNEATGKIPYGFTNDYMFRAVFQKNQKALKGLLSAVLGMPQQEIVSCEITNPIILGEAIDDKTCVLDIRLVLNYDKKINLEMQIGNILNWPKRSLYYTCDMYVDLHKGEDYAQAQPCIHIGFVNTSPFPDYHNFYSKYQLVNVENGHVYTGDFVLIMIQLDQVNKVVVNDQNREIHRWVKLFMAREWEEVLQMAEESDAMQEAVVTLRNMTEDEKIKLQCWARKRYEADKKNIYTTGMERGREQGLEQGLEQGVKAFIKICTQFGRTRNETRQHLEQEFELSSEQAEEYLEKYWVT
ncbi:Rpn family recombination-promoting nuclease/putative transposase [Blautia schinkii]|nr:Rpn family recombination-promoting nuclease/putative transposase [Blautia schinkii]